MHTPCRKQLNFLFILCSSLLLFTACVQTQTSPEPSGTTLYTDNFENDSGNWSERLDEDGSMIGHQAGGLRFVINTPQRDKISVLKTGQDNAVMAVEALKLNGPDDNLFGLVCRRQDALNYYAFLVSSDAYYGIAKVEEGAYQMLTSEYMQVNEDVILQGLQNNTIRVGCVQNALWLEVNGTVLAGIYDETFSTGDVGLIAGSTAEAGVDILFDNFTLSQP